MLLAKELFHSRLHAFIHLDERRPGAFETFARQFLRRVETLFAPDGDFARRVVEHVDDCSSRRESAHSLSVRFQCQEHIAKFERTDVRCYSLEWWSRNISGVWSKRRRIE